MLYNNVLSFLETPLTLAVGIKKPGKVLMALVNGGAILDYRTRDGSTAMHRAVEKGSLEALSTLLELGASPNYKDGKGLTPLYLTVTHRTDPMLAQTLLHDRAVIGAQDLQGWQEVHQVTILWSIEVLLECFVVQAHKTVFPCLCRPAAMDLLYI